MPVNHETSNYVIQVLDSPEQLDAGRWNELLDVQTEPTPFMRHEYLLALHQSASAVAQTGWTPRFITLIRDDRLVAACALYVKAHSYGEYVFDHAWANAYARHGLNYYPKAVLAVPFTPVPGSRLMAHSAADRLHLIQTVLAWCKSDRLSSLHLLFGSAVDIQACEEAGMLLRHSVQFHWKNMAPTLATSCASLPPEGANSLGAARRELPLPPEDVRLGVDCPGTAKGHYPYTDFQAFLTSLTRDKRRKIQQERRKVADAGVSFRWSRGTTISATDWDFFYCCYEHTYLEHGNSPYLNRDFFRAMADTLPDNWLLFVAERERQPIASSLVALHESGAGRIAYGRYWGALERVDCLHFETCYYQPLQWCIAHGYHRFEGGAQGEHKMARALLPVRTDSAHWLAEPAFAAAVAQYLEREAQAVEQHLGALALRSPLRNPDA